MNKVTAIINRKNCILFACLLAAVLAVFSFISFAQADDKEANCNELTDTNKKAECIIKRMEANKANFIQQYVSLPEQHKDKTEEKAQEEKKPPMFNSITPSKPNLLIPLPKSTVSSQTTITSDSETNDSTTAITEAPATNQVGVNNSLTPNIRNDVYSKDTTTSRYENTKNSSQGSSKPQESNAPRSMYQ